MLWALGGCGATLRAADPAAAPPADRQRFAYQQTLMGMDFQLLLYAPTEGLANAAAEAAWRRIAALDGAMSDYQPESELMRLCRDSAPGRPVRVSDDLWRVMSVAQLWSQRSDGAFDVTVGPLVRQWRRARRQHRLPSAQALSEARALVGHDKLALHAEDQSVELLRPGMRLDLGGIAVGHAVDEALRLLRERGIAAALLDGSGDVGCYGAPSGQDAWSVEVQAIRAKVDTEPADTPRLIVPLRDAAISTSGDLYQFVEIDGVRYSHIVDPATGLGLTRASSITIIAPDCTTADALATAVSVLGPERGLTLVETVEGAAALFVWLEDGETRRRVAAPEAAKLFGQ